jgi:hypothetical protein
MTQQRRQNILVGVMIAMLVVATAWSFEQLLDQRAEAQQTADDLARSQRLAGQIRQLRTRPTVATTQAKGYQELAQHLSEAARKAGAPSAITGVYPDPPERQGDSPYLRTDTRITLKGLSLQQTAMFLYHATAESDLAVRSLHLQGSGRDGDAWAVDTTVSYLIYAPDSANGD